jgi:HK97 family phage major capsid protein
MTIHISEPQIFAVKKHAMPALRKLKISDFDNMDFHKLTWSDLNARAKTAKIAARSVADKLTDGLDADTAESVEAAFDGLLAIHEALETEMDHRTEAGSKGPREHAPSPRVPMIGDGVTSRGSDGPEIATVGLSREQRMVDYVSRDNPRSEYADLSLGKYFRAMVCGGRTDLEMRALSEGTDSSGGFSVPDILGAQMVDLLRAQSVTTQAGAITIPLTSDSHSFARVASDPVPGWRNENAAVAESDPTFDNVPLTPRSLAVLVKASRELIEDSVNLDQELPRIMAAALAVEWDRVALLGSGSAPEPTGIANTANIGTAALAGALTSYAPLVSARTAVKTANAMPTAIIMHPRDEGTLAGLTASDNQPLNAPSQISEIPWLTTTSIPVNGGTGTDESSIFMGDFTKLILGVRTEIRIDVSRELYAENMQYGFFCHLRADVAVANPTAFHVKTAVTG